MSVCAQVDMVEVDGERAGSNGHGGGGSVWAAKGSNKDW